MTTYNPLIYVKHPYKVTKQAVITLVIYSSNSFTYSYLVFWVCTNCKNQQLTVQCKFEVVNSFLSSVLYQSSSCRKLYHLPSYHDNRSRKQMFFVLCKEEKWSESAGPLPEEIQDDDCQKHPHIFDPCINTVPPLDEPQDGVGEPHCIKYIQSLPLCSLNKTNKLVKNLMDWWQWSPFSHFKHMIWAINNLWATTYT